MGLHRLGSYLSQQIWNENANALELLGYATDGRAVAYGLQLSAGDGLTLTISAGTLLTGGAAKQQSEITIQAPPSVSRYVWLDEDELITMTATADDVGGTAVCLGRVFADADEITAVTAEGRCEAARWTGLREYTIGSGTAVFDLASGLTAFGGEMETAGDARFSAEVSADRVKLRTRSTAPDPGAGGAALYVSDGELRVVRESDSAVSLTRGLRPISHGWASRALALSADLSLSSEDAPIQALQAAGADRAVRLPTTSSLNWGSWLRILNVGDTHDLEIKTSDGATTLGTLSPGEYAELVPTALAGLPAWPASLTPQSLPTAVGA